MRIGALYQGNGNCLFRVFAPEAERLSIEFPKRGEIRPLSKNARGYWEARWEDIPPGTLYKYRINEGASYPDPASFYQPEGVPGASQVWDHGDFNWTDQHWMGHPLDEAIIYELHAGTFTQEGTLEAVASKLPHFKDLGVNTIEIMPVNQFPGVRNWGYDGAYPYAVQHSYGGPQSLKQLVDACHAEGIAVILDVVYNHVGPEGNYFQEFAPYFTQNYQTPWGKAINFDAGYSDQIRAFFVENALYWLREFHIDGLRLDATHQIYDMSARHFLAELSEQVTHFSERNGRRRHLIAESDLNDPRMLSGKETGGHGMHAQWLDDFQHCIDAMLRKDKSHYGADYGATHRFVKANREGFVYAGEYSPMRGRRFGASSALRSPGQFVVSTQHHDRIGNRPLGERLNSLIGQEAYKLAAGALFASPYIPMLFMGEEYGESNPFQFFADYCDPELVKAVCAGRQMEFMALHSGIEVPNPCALETFQCSRLDWNRMESGGNRIIYEFYRELIALRKSLPPLRRLSREGMEMEGKDFVFSMVRRSFGTSDGESGELFCLMNFNDHSIKAAAPVHEGNWELLLDSSDARWGGPGRVAQRTCGPGDTLDGNPYNFLLYRKVS